MRSHVGDIAQPLEDLDFAFGLGAIGLTQAWNKTCPLGEIPQPGMKAVLLLTVGVALAHHGAHVVIEHLPWHTLKIGESVLMIALEGVKALIRDKLNVAVTAPA